MSVNFYDVNFNQSPDLEQTNIPSISGYIIDDDGYNNRVAYEGRISEGNLISKASATNNIPGAISMARKRIEIDESTSITCCPLRQGNNVYVIYSDVITTVVIVDDSGNTVESLTLPYDSNSSNLSFIGHFDSNNELDWLSVCCTHYDEVTQTYIYIINTDGFSSSFTNGMKPYTYLKYKYEYQVVIQQSLKGSDGFVLSRFPDFWYSKKEYGTGSGQSQDFSQVVCGDNLGVDKAAAWWGDRTISTNPQWYYDGTAQRNNPCVDLSLYMASVVGGMSTPDAETSFVFGSDILRRFPNGQFYNGVDLNEEHLAWTYTNPYGTFEPYDIEFTEGKIRLTFVGLNRYIQILDNDDNVIDQWQMPYPVSGGGSSIRTGALANGAYDTIMSAYLAIYNNHYYLIGLYQGNTPVYDEDHEQISFPGTGYAAGMHKMVYFKILKRLNNEANTLLYKSTSSEKLVPADPDSLKPENTSNQTSDSDHKNEYGNEIPQPIYNDGDWGDGTNDGIRGSGNAQETGGNAEGKLDQQPGLPGKPNIPTPVSTGFMKLYAPIESEIQDLCIELTDDSILTTLKKYFGNNPLDFIVGLQVVPGDYTKSQYKYKIQYGSYASDVSMYAITDELTTLDYGELDLKEIYGSWEDYNPHTKMSIYLPYIGIKELDPDKINGTQLKLKYHIDACTGSILAVLTSVRKDEAMFGKEIVVGQWPGQASYTIPLTNTQHDASVNAILGIVGATAGIGLAVATGGASALVTAGAVGAVGNALLSGAKSQKTDISMQGSVGGGLSFFTGTDAYIQIEFPKEGRPDDYNHIIGMPSNITTTLAEQPLNNYIEFVNVDVSGIDAPTDEKNAIINLLKGGVYT